MQLDCRKSDSGQYCMHMSGVSAAGQEFFVHLPMTGRAGRLNFYKTVFKLLCSEWDNINRGSGSLTKLRNGHVRLPMACRWRVAHIVTVGVGESRFISGFRNGYL